MQIDRRATPATQRADSGATLRAASGADSAAVPAAPDTDAAIAPERDPLCDPDAPIAPMLLLPGPECRVTERYEHVDIGAWAGTVPLMKVVHGPNPFARTPEQQRAAARAVEEHYLSLSLMRALARETATALGHAAQCERRACRRARACTGSRDENDWSFPGPWMVPCARTVRSIDAIRTIVAQLAEAAGETEREPEPSPEASGGGGAQPSSVRLSSSSVGIDTT